MASSKTGFASLEPAYVFRLLIDKRRPVGMLPTGQSHYHFELPSGTMTTVEGFEPKINAKTEVGADWMYLDPDQATARVNIKGMAKTDDGDILGFSYKGTIKFNEDIQLIFESSPDMHTTPFGQEITTHTFEAPHPKYSKLTNNSWVGNGRFIVENGQLSVESKVSMVVASTDSE